MLSQCFGWAEHLLEVIRPRGSVLRTSTAFSGIGCPEIAGKAIEHAAGRGLFVPLAAIEKDHFARAVLADHASPVPCGADILQWLPPDVRARALIMSGDTLRDLLLGNTFSPNMCGADRKSYVYGDLHIAGSPCIDFSPMGIGRKECGPSMPCFLTWARGLREQRPIVAIVENVARFPISLLGSVFGDMYAVDSVLPEAKDFGMAAKRRRLYIAY